MSSITMLEFSRDKENIIKFLNDNFKAYLIPEIKVYETCFRKIIIIQYLRKEKNIDDTIKRTMNCKSYELKGEPIKIDSIEEVILSEISLGDLLFILDEYSYYKYNMRNERKNNILMSNKKSSIVPNKNNKNIRTIKNVNNKGIDNKKINIFTNDKYSYNIKEEYNYNKSLKEFVIEHFSDASHLKRIIIVNNKCKILCNIKCNYDKNKITNVSNIYTYGDNTFIYNFMAKVMKILSMKHLEKKINYYIKDYNGVYLYIRLLEGEN